MTNTGFGARLVGRVGGGLARIREYYVPSTDGTALYQGDFVMLPSSPALDPNSEVPVVTRASSGSVLLGVIVGFKPDASLPYTGQFRAASTNRYVEVCDDPQAIYEIQEDAVGGAAAAADIAAMSNYNIVVAAGSTVTGLSGTMLQSSSVTEAAADLKVVGVRRDPSNPGNVAGTNGAILQVKILSAAINATESDN